MADISLVPMAYRSCSCSITDWGVVDRHILRLGMGKYHLYQAELFCPMPGTFIPLIVGIPESGVPPLHSSVG